MALRLLPHLLSKSAVPYRPVTLLNTLASGRTPFPFTASSSPYTLPCRHYAKFKPKKEVKAAKALSKAKGAKGAKEAKETKGAKGTKAKGTKVEEKEEEEKEKEEEEGKEKETEEKEAEEETEGKEEKEEKEKEEKEKKEEAKEEETEADDNKETSKDKKLKKKTGKDKESKDKPSKDTKGKDKTSKAIETKDKETENKDKGTENKDKDTEKKDKNEAKDEEEEEVETKSTKSRFGKKKPKKEKLPASVTKSTGNVLEDTIRQIEHVFGKGALMKLTNDSKTVKLMPNEVIPTGSLGLDLALGVGGLPQGRVTEIFGPESSGKTTLALHVIAEAQKQGKYCAFIDAEHALNPQWASKLGVNTDELLISQPDSGEQALEIVDSLIKSGKTNVIVIDSVAALVPKVELEGEMGDAHIGVQARLMSQALRKISPSLTKSQCVLIFINQIRMKIGVMFGNPETTTGGNALKFYSSVRLDIRRIGSVKKGEDIIGNQIRVKVAKNKLAPPFREALFDIDFGKGISKLGEVIDWGVKAQVLEKMGAWYAYQGTQIGQGREKTKAYLEEHPDVAQEIEETIREKLLKGEIDVDEETDTSENTEEDKVADE